MSLLRIHSVEPLEGFRLRLRLTNDAVIQRDISALTRGPVLQELRSDSAKFCDARVEGGTVAWENGADLCPDVLIWGGPPPLNSDTVTAAPTMALPRPGTPSRAE